jgi:hypothetical protein
MEGCKSSLRSLSLNAIAIGDIVQEWTVGRRRGKKHTWRGLTTLQVTLGARPLNLELQPVSRQLRSPVGFDRVVLNITR